LYLEAADPAGRLEYDLRSHRAIWQGHLDAAGRSREIKICWGPGTPYMAPAIVPVGCWSAVHQLRDGSMCLLRPEGLAAGYIGVPDLSLWLKRATTWFEGYVREQWAIDCDLWPFVALQRPAAGYRLDLLPMRLMGLPHDWRLRSFEKVGQFRALVPKDKGLGAITEWSPGTKGRWRQWEEARTLVDGEPEEHLGVWIRADLRLQELRRPFEHLVKQLSRKSRRKGRRLLLAIGTELTGENGPSWLIQAMEPGDALEKMPTLEALGPNPTPAAVQELVVSSVERTIRWAAEFVDTLVTPWRGIVLDTRTLDARRRSGRPDKVNRRISSAQVAIVGLGALGSEVAHLLAQEGVGSFLLVDGDLLLPGNVARHRAGLADAGRPKVQAVEQDIKRINPAAQVNAVASWIDEQIPRLTFIDAGTDEPFVAVGLTGDEASEHVLSELTSMHRKHCIHAWMEMDGRVLRLFRALNGKDPALLELGRDPESSIPPLPRSSGLAVRPQECAEAVSPGSAGNVHAAANFIVRAALDVITGREEDENHWLFAPDGVRDEAAELVPRPLRSRYGLVGFRLPVRAHEMAADK